MPETTNSPSANSLPSQNIIALVYDFDGTLSPQPMQEYTVLPKLGIDPQSFWKKVTDEAQQTETEAMLVYMRHLTEAIEDKKIKINREDFTAMGRMVKYFQGVEDWFERINRFVESISRDQTIEVRHYVISAGLKEILDGVSIAPHFHKMFASEYHYNYLEAPVFPKLLITDTNKTQFLFRINKGVEDLRGQINDHMPNEQRPVPFSNMVYIGDGLTDVPSMAVVKQNGGHALAVYNDQDSQRLSATLGTCKSLLKANRIDFFAAANYAQDSELERLMKLILEYTVTRIRFNQTV